MLIFNYVKDTHHTLAKKPKAYLLISDVCNKSKVTKDCSFRVLNLRPPTRRALSLDLPLDQKLILFLTPVN